MKIPHLPITDLARIAVLPRDMQLYALRQVTTGGIGPNYNPTRVNLPDLVDRQPGTFPSVRTAWPIVRANVIRRCRSEREQTMNLAVSKSLYDYCVEKEVRAIELEGYPISFSVGPKLVCWAPALFVYPDRLAIPFMDLRRSHALTREAQRFIFSAKHEALRVNNPDYGDVGLEILKFEDESTRPIKLISEAGFRLFSYDELENMIAYTQRLWFAVIEEREKKRRSSGTKGTNDLL